MTHDLPNKANRSSRFPWTGYIGPVITWGSILVAWIWLSVLPSNTDGTEWMVPVGIVYIAALIGGLVSLIFLIVFYRRRMVRLPEPDRSPMDAATRKRAKTSTMLGVILNVISLGMGLMVLNMYLL